jgi:hypothetical protein
MLYLHELILGHVTKTLNTSRGHITHADTTSNCTRCYSVHYLYEAETPTAKVILVHSSLLISVKQTFDSMPLIYAMQNSHKECSLSYFHRYNWSINYCWEISRVSFLKFQYNIGSLACNTQFYKHLENRAHRVIFSSPCTSRCSSISGVSWGSCRCHDDHARIHSRTPF